MSPRLHAVLLCAEEDDLDLVELVHAGRQIGLELEVVPGIEQDDEPLMDVLERTGAALFVLMRSEHLSQMRARAIRRVFAHTRNPGQHLIALPVDPSRFRQTVDAILHRLRLVEDEPEPEPESEEITFAPDRATTRGAEIITLSETSSLPSPGDRHRFDVSSTWSFRGQPDETTRGRIDAVSDVSPPRTRPGPLRWATVILLAGGIATGAIVYGPACFDAIAERWAGY